MYVLIIIINPKIDYLLCYTYKKFSNKISLAKYFYQFIVVNRI